MAKLPLAPFSIYKLIREAGEADTPVVVHVGGARELAGALRRELQRGAAPSSVREADLAALDEDTVLVYVLAAQPTDEDRRILRGAEKANAPVACVLAAPLPRGGVPHVLATEVVEVGAGEGFPLDELGRILGGKLDEKAPALAARVPALRRGVADALIASAARRNGVLGAAVFVPGADIGVLTLNQIRLVLGLARAYGQELDRERLPAIAAVIGSGLGLRAAARQLLGLVPLAGWAVKGAVAYAGTRALGEAAREYLELRAPTQPRDEAARDAP